MTENPDVLVGVRSIFGAQTRRGLVELTLGAEQTLMTPAKAREVAAFLVEAATAAEGDEVLVAQRQERAILERRARAEAREAIAFDQEQADHSS